ncbi:MAG: tetratricopeptide repeat protein [Motiliproteus sp.]
MISTEKTLKARLLLPCLIVAILLTGCNTLPAESEKHAEYSSLGDPQAALSYSTAFPIASAQEAVLRGDAAVTKGDLDRALFEYIRALEKEGADPEILYKVGRVHLARGDTRRAEVAFFLVLKEMPDHAGGLTEVGIIRMRHRDHQSAKSFLSRALQITPDSSRIFNALGVLEDMQKKHPQAQNNYASAIALDGRIPLYLNNLGYSHYQMGDLINAENAFVDALRLDPGYERAWRNLALVYAKSRRYSEALQAFGKTEQEHQAYNDVGYVAMVTGRYADAQRFFEEAIRLSPMYYELAESNARRLVVLQQTAPAATEQSIETGG